MSLLDTTGSLQIRISTWFHIAAVVSTTLAMQSRSELASCRLIANEGLPARTHEATVIVHPGTASGGGLGLLGHIRLLCNQGSLGNPFEENF
jgi:hypothetical protein